MFNTKRYFSLMFGWSCLYFLTTMLWANDQQKSTSLNKIYSVQSAYQKISVSQSNQMRCLRFNVKNGSHLYQSCYSLANPQLLILKYTQMLFSTLLIHDKPKNMLIIGLGGGSLQSAFQKLLPNTHIDTVELDPAVVDVAKKYFNLKQSNKNVMHVGDGRVFVRKAQKQNMKYDIVILDAFGGDYIPEHLMTREFLKEVQSLLTEEGVLAANTFSKSRLYHHESVTYQSVFGNLISIKSKDSSNRIILVSNKPGSIDIDQMRENGAIKHWEFQNYGADTEEIIRNLSTSIDWDTSARILDDNYSPVNALKNQ